MDFIIKIHLILVLFFFPYSHLFMESDTKTDRAALKQRFQSTLQNKQALRTIRRNNASSLVSGVLARAKQLLPQAKAAVSSLSEDDYKHVIHPLLNRLTVLCARLTRDNFSPLGRSSVYKAAKYNPRYTFAIALTRQFLDYIGSGFFPTESPSSSSSSPPLVFNTYEDIVKSITPIMRNTRESWDWVNEFICTTCIAFTAKASDSAEESARAANVPSFDYIEYIRRLGTFIKRDVQLDDFVPLYELHDAAKENSDHDPLESLYLEDNHAKYITILGSLNHSDSSSSTSGSSVADDSEEVSSISTLSSDGEEDQREEGVHVV
jgi:hypothetical protein